MHDHPSCTRFVRVDATVSATRDSFAGERRRCGRPATTVVRNRMTGFVSYRCDDHLGDFDVRRYSFAPLAMP